MSMLKVDMDVERGSLIVTSSGDICDMVTDIMYVAASVYQSLKKHDPEIAKAFQILVCCGVSDAETWETETGNRGAVIEFRLPVEERDENEDLNLSAESG